MVDVVKKTKDLNVVVDGFEIVFSNSLDFLVGRGTIISMRIMHVTKLATLLLALTLVSGAALMSSVVSADESVVDEINITVPVSCTISGVGMTSHNATINNGVLYGSVMTDVETDELTYDGIGTTTLHAFCNDNNGFAIYAAGFTGNEVGGTNSNKLVGTSASGNASIGTGTGLGTTQDISEWAMAVYKISDSGDTSGSDAFTIEADSEGTFRLPHSVPNQYTKIAHKNSATDMDSVLGGVKMGTTYFVYISKTQPADTYSGQVIYTLVHPASHAAPVACKPSGTTISTIACMQDITSTNKTSVMASMTEGTQYTLKDKRDGKEYKVAKLADGKVWMTQNLDLDIDSSRTYTNEDTDLGWNTSTNQYDTASWSPTRSTYAIATNNIHEWCVGGTWNTEWGGCDNNNTPESYDPGDLYWNTTTSDSSDWDAYYDSCDYSTTTPSCDESLNPLSTYISSTGTQQYHLGNYYNWPAAIASNDASIYGAYNETTGEYENLETHQSICPVGWTLPYINYNNNTDQDEGDFVNLWTEYGWDSNSHYFTDGISTVWSAPLYFTPAGIFYGNFEYAGYGGYFWSSVAAGDSQTHGAYFDMYLGATPAGDDSRCSGFSIRCLLR